jgi:hypothetical protein
MEMNYMAPLIFASAVSAVAYILSSKKDIKYISLGFVTITSAGIFDYMNIFPGFVSLLAIAAFFLFFYAIFISDPRTVKEEKP